MPRTPESPHNKADSGRRIWDLEQPDLEPVTLTPVSSELKLSSLQNLKNNEAGWAGISREKAGELGIVEIHTRGRSIGDMEWPSLAGGRGVERNISETDGTNFLLFD